MKRIQELSEECPAFHPSIVVSQYLKAETHFLPYSYGFVLRDSFSVWKNAMLAMLCDDSNMKTFINF